MASNMLVYHKCKAVGVNPKPLDKDELAKLVISNSGDDPRNRITSLGGPKETTIAAAIIHVSGTTV